MNDFATHIKWPKAKYWWEDRLLFLNILRLIMAKYMSFGWTPIDSVGTKDDPDKRRFGHKFTRLAFTRLLPGRLCLVHRNGK